MSNDGNKKSGFSKLLVTIGSYFLIIAAVVFFVVIKFGLTYDITKVMPDFRRTIYSESNFYQYDLNTLNAARNQLMTHYNKVKNEVYKEKDYYEEGHRGMLYYNLKNIESAMDKLNIATFSEAYATLSEVPYIDYLTDPIFKYDNKKHTNKLGLSLDFTAAVDCGLYYEVPCMFYEPFLLSKASFSELPLNATMSVLEHNPYVEEGFAYVPYVKRDTALLEYPALMEDEEGNPIVVTIPVILDNYDDEFLVGYEGNEYKMMPGPYTDLRILKGTYVGYTANYLFTAALRVFDEKWGNRHNPYFPIEEVIETAQHEELQDSTDIAMNTVLTNPYYNHIIYDKKGYVTDLAYVGAKAQN